MTTTNSYMDMWSDLKSMVQKEYDTFEDCGTHKGILTFMTILERKYGINVPDSRMIRLQGSEFYRELSDLTMVAYSKSPNGNICGYYSYFGSNRVDVYHWLSDYEKEEFLKKIPDNLPKVPNHKAASKIKLEV